MLGYNIYEDWGYNYDTELQLLLEQQGSSGGGNNNEDLPPDFDTLMKRIEIAGNTAVITAGAWNLLKKSGKTLLQKSYELGTLFADSTIPDGINVPIEDIDSSTTAIFHSDDNRLFSGFNYTDMIFSTTKPISFVGKNMYFISIDNKLTPFKSRLYKNGEMVREENATFLSGYLYDVYTHNEGYRAIIYRREINYDYSVITKYPKFNSEEEALNYLKPYITSDNSRQDEPIWITPELKDTYENKGEFEFPENMPDSLRIPNIDDLQELARRLNPDSNPDYNPEEIPEYIKQYINDLKVDPNPNPDPDNPDKPTNPDTPTNNDTFLADLKHLFPFCIPFDLVDCFKLFNAEPVTPRVEIPVHFGIINYDHTFVIDLKDFNGVAVVCRSAFLIIYMAGLILATRALIKG